MVAKLLNYDPNSNYRKLLENILDLRSTLVLKMVKNKLVRFTNVSALL